MLTRTEGSPPVEILLVEDNAGDYRLTQEALREGKVYNNLHWAKDGVEALDFLHRRGSHGKAPRPDLILTTSQAEEDIVRSYHLHANCYVTKPVDLEKFIVVVQSIDCFWLTIATLPRA